MTTFKFSVTRGIPNKLKTQDGSFPKNPVVGSILPVGAPIASNAVMVYSAEDQTINEEFIKVPIGTPLLLYINGLPIGTFINSSLIV